MFSPKALTLFFFLGFWRRQLLGLGGRRPRKSPRGWELTQRYGLVLVSCWEPHECGLCRGESCEGIAEGAGEGDSLVPLHGRAGALEAFCGS